MGIRKEIGVGGPEEKERKRREWKKKVEEGKDSCQGKFSQGMPQRPKNCNTSPSHTMWTIPQPSTWLWVLG